MEHTHIYGC